MVIGAVGHDAIVMVPEQRVPKVVSRFSVGARGALAVGVPLVGRGEGGPTSKSFIQLVGTRNERTGGRDGERDAGAKEGG